MSKKYKDAMDKIVLSDELKTKIIENTTKNHLSVKEKKKRTRTFYVRYGVGYAACLLLCVLAVSVSQNIIETNNMPSVTNAPNYVSPATEPTDTVSPTQPTNDTLPENNSIENQEPAGNIAQNNINHHLAAETQRPQVDGTNTASPPETQAPENSAPVSSENNEENPLDASPGDSNNEVALPVNPSTDAENFSDVREQLGYDFKVPKYLPEGYELDTVSLLFGSLVQISYLSENDEIVYRTEKTNADISGDYHVYDTVESETINNVDTTLKSSDEVFYGAVWYDGNMSYSIQSTNGFDKDTLVKIVESTDYPDERAEGFQVDGVADDEDSTVHAPGQPTEEIDDEKENNETPEQSKRIDTVDNMD